MSDGIAKLTLKSITFISLCEVGMGGTLNDWKSLALFRHAYLKSLI